MKPGAQLRATARWAFIRILRATGALARAKRAIASENAILVLTLHRVLTPAERRYAYSEDGIIVSRDNFEALTRYLARDFEVISLADVASGAWPAPSTKPRVIITFDDGWQDNYEPVREAASRLSLPFTIFVCSDLAGRASPFWPERVRALMSAANGEESQQTIERLKPLPRAEREAAIQSLAVRNSHREPSASSPDATMPWESIRELARAGVNFGSHTKTHEILTTLSPADLEPELVESRIALEHQLGEPCRTIAYPNGNHSELVRRVTRQAGYSLGVAVQNGLWTQTTDRFAIPRMNISDSRISGVNGKFCPLAFDYGIVWRAYRAHQRHTAEELRIQRSAGALRQPE